MNEAFLPIFGGALTGLAAVAYPEILYQGFSNVNAILQVLIHLLGQLCRRTACLKVIPKSVPCYPQPE